jgi:uncharacterized protein with PQ loop repeat
MNTNKILLSALVGGVVLFLMGWLVYGILLADFLDANTGQAAKGLAKEPIIMWAIIVANLAMGLLLAIIFGRWAEIKTFSTGAVAGAVIFLLMSIGYNLSVFSMFDLMNLTGSLVDAVVWAVHGAVAGGVVGWVLGMGKSE